MQALRTWLTGLQGTVSYAEAMRVMALPHMKDLTQALELLMEQDLSVGRPILAALVVSRTHPRPNRGFFDKARALGLVIEDEGAFHAAQLAALGKVAPKN